MYLYVQKNHSNPSKGAPTPLLKTLHAVKNILKSTNRARRQDRELEMLPSAPELSRLDINSYDDNFTESSCDKFSLNPPSYEQVMNEDRK